MSHGAGSMRDYAAVGDPGCNQSCINGFIWIKSIHWIIWRHRPFFSPPERRLPNSRSSKLHRLLGGDSQTASLFDVICRHLTSFGVIWPHLTSCDVIWPHLTSFDLIWRPKNLIINSSNVNHLHGLCDINWDWSGSRHTRLVSFLLLGAGEQFSNLGMQSNIRKAAKQAVCSFPMTWRFLCIVQTSLNVLNVTWAERALKVLYRYYMLNDWTIQPLNRQTFESLNHQTLESSNRWIVKKFKSLSLRIIIIQSLNYQIFESFNQPI